MPAPEANETQPFAVALQRVPRVLEHGRKVASALTARPLVALAGLVVAQWLAILAYALTVRHNGWLYYQGGDQIWLLTTGWLLGDGQLAPTYVGYGWPLAVAPIMRLTGPSFIDAMPPVIALNVLVLGPLVLWALYDLSSRLAGRVFGLITAGAWVVLPFAVIPLWRDDYHERYVEQFLPGALGLTALADYQSMVLLLLGAAVFVRALETRAAFDAVAAGLLVGFAIGVKPSNGIFLAAPIVAAALLRNLRQILPFAIGCLPALLTLALWKHRGLGSLPAFALEESRLVAAAVASAPDVDRYINLDWANLHDNANHLREYFWSARLLEWIPFAGTVGVARRSLPLAGLLATWFLAFLVLKGTTPLSTVSSGSFFRFMMPAYPAYFLLAVSTLLLVPTLARDLARRWPEAPARRLDPNIVMGLTVLLAVVPIPVIALARPFDSARKAIVVNEILTPVDEQIRVAVRADAEARIIAWAHPRTSSDVFYRVFRTGAGGAHLECAEHGTRECRLEMLLLGTTREPRWRDGSPPVGSLYRIGVAANSRNDAAGGDVATISRPVPSE